MNITNESESESHSGVSDCNLVIMLSNKVGLDIERLK